MLEYIVSCFSSLDFLFLKLFWPKSVCGLAYLISPVVLKQSINIDLLQTLHPSLFWCTRFERWPNILAMQVHVGIGGVQLTYGGLQLSHAGWCA
jgi:hypothetical protein